MGVQRMKTGVLILAGALVLSACAPQQFDRPRGVGFDDLSNFDTDRARREAALAGGVDPSRRHLPFNPPRSALLAV